MYQIECESCPHEWMLGSAATQIQKSRAKLAEYIKANKEDIVLIENCTAATASVIRAVGLRAGDTAIHLSTAYGMVKNCLSYCAAATGANVVEVKVEFSCRMAPVSRNGHPLDLVLAKTIDEAISKGSRVALVTFDYISSCPGVIMPVHTLAKVCKSRGVPCFIDGAHVLGQLKLNCFALEASGVTFFMSDAHKWLFSPKGSAILWVSRSAQTDVYPSVIGAVCSNSPATSFHPDAICGLSDFELRFQYTGTRDYTPMIAVSDALSFRKRIGENVILGYNHGLALWAQEWLSTTWRTEILVPPECTAAMAHVRMPVQWSGAAVLLNRMLKDKYAMHVMCFALPARVHLGEAVQTHWVRPCVQLFISRDDVLAFGLAVQELAPRCDSVAKYFAKWQASSRARKQLRATCMAPVMAHKITLGFCVAPTEPVLQHENSAHELADESHVQHMSAESSDVAAVAKYSAGNLGSGQSCSVGVGFKRNSSTSAPRRVEHKDALLKPRSISNEKGVGDVRQSPNSVIDFMGTACTSLLGASV